MIERSRQNNYFTKSTSKRKKDTLDKLVDWAQQNFIKKTFNIVSDNNPCKLDLVYRQRWPLIQRMKILFQRSVFITQEKSTLKKRIQINNKINSSRIFVENL